MPGGNLLLPFLFVSTVATVKSIQSGKRATRAAQQAQKVSQRRADLATQRERIKNVRQSRILRGHAEAASTSGEGTGGSGLQGTTQGLFQQQATNLAFLDQTQRFSQEISNLNISAARHTSKASAAASIAGVSSNFAGLFTP